MSAEWSCQPNTASEEPLALLSPWPYLASALLLVREVLDELPGGLDVVAAHVAVGGQPLKLRLLQLEVALDAPGAEVEVALHDVAKRLVVLRAGAVCGWSFAPSFSTFIFRLHFPFMTLFPVLSWKNVKTPVV